MGYMAAGKNPSISLESLKNIHIDTQYLHSSYLCFLKPMLERKCFELQAQALFDCVLYLRCWVHFLYWVFLTGLLERVKKACQVKAKSVPVCQAVRCSFWMEVRQDCRWAEAWIVS
jgi:hypothetical protein